MIARCIDPSGKTICLRLGKRHLECLQRHYISAYGQSYRSNSVVVALSRYSAYPYPALEMVES